MIWNEYSKNGFMGTRSPYYMQIDRLLTKGKRVDCIGLQFHQFIRREDELTNGSLPFDPVKLYAVMDCYGRFGKPLHVSEITIPAYECGPDEEAIQMELTKDLYRTWFSHPAMDGIIWWNLVDGYAAFAPRNTKEGGKLLFRRPCSAMNVRKTCLPGSQRIDPERMAHQ